MSKPSTGPGSNWAPPADVAGIHGPGSSPAARFGRYSDRGEGSAARHTYRVLTTTRLVDDRICHVENASFLARTIAGARYVEHDGGDHLPWFKDADAFIGELREFLTGEREVVVPDRVLATLLFTDIVGSTEHAAKLGDQRGVHTGEIERVDGMAAGIAVHVGARVAAGAGPGEVRVSEIVRQLTAGSGIELEDRGVHELKGVPGTWQLWSVA